MEVVRYSRLDMYRLKGRITSEGEPILFDRPDPINGRKDQPSKEVFTSSSVEVFSKEESPMFSK